jgi:hypothetical protein
VLYNVCEAVICWDVKRLLLSLALYLVPFEVLSSKS